MNNLAAQNLAAQNPWILMLQIILLTSAIAMFVAFVIHIMGWIVHNFTSGEESVADKAEAAAVAKEEEEVELAIALVVAKRAMEQK